MMSSCDRRAVLRLYKTLAALGREWPGGAELFRERLHAVFSRPARAAELPGLLARGDFVRREIEALYRLKKYRAMKRRYYDEGK